MTNPARSTLVERLRKKNQHFSERDIAEARRIVGVICERLWNGEVPAGEHLWSLPANPARDFDFVLTDMIDELEARREDALRQTPATREKFDRLYNLVSNLAHPKGDHCENELEDEAHSIIYELHEATLRARPDAPPVSASDLPVEDDNAAKQFRQDAATSHADQQGDYSNAATVPELQAARKLSTSAVGPVDGDPGVPLLQTRVVAERSDAPAVTPANQIQRLQRERSDFIAEIQSELETGWSDAPTWKAAILDRIAHYKQAALAQADPAPRAPTLYKRHEQGCINCGEENDGGYEVENGPGPFCSLCWDALEHHFMLPRPTETP